MRRSWLGVMAWRGSRGFDHSGTGAGSSMAIFPCFERMPTSALVTDLAMDQLSIRTFGPNPGA